MRAALPTLTCGLVVSARPPVAHTASGSSQLRPPRSAIPTLRHECGWTCTVHFFPETRTTCLTAPSEVSNDRLVGTWPPSTDTLKSTVKLNVR